MSDTAALFHLPMSWLGAAAPLNLLGAGQLQLQGTQAHGQQQHRPVVYPVDRHARRRQTVDGRCLHLRMLQHANLCCNTSRQAFISIRTVGGQ